MMYTFLLVNGIFGFAIATPDQGVTSQIYQVASTNPSVTSEYQLTRYEQGLEDYDEALARQRQGRGMMDDDDYVHHHDHEPQQNKNEITEQKAVANDPWAGYYDFIINEGSFKFWAVFQLVTAALLIYSAVAAVYYAKFNIITTDYDYYYDFFGRSDSGRSETGNSWFGLDTQTFQRVLDAISFKKYS